MPTYEYRCDKCGHEFEREQRITDDPVKKCPGCRSARVKRLISATSFVLKGGGWYSDLYSSKKAQPAAGDSKSDAKDTSAPATGSAAGDTAPKATPGGDAKPAADKGGKKKATKTAAA